MTCRLRFPSHTNAQIRLDNGKGTSSHAICHPRADSFPGTTIGGIIHAFVNESGRRKMKYTVHHPSVVSIHIASAMAMSGVSGGGYSHGCEAQYAIRLACMRRRLLSRPMGIDMPCVMAPIDLLRYRTKSIGWTRIGFLPRFFFRILHVLLHQVHWRLRLPNRMLSSLQQEDFARSVFIHANCRRSHRIRLIPIGCFKNAANQISVFMSRSL